MRVSWARHWRLNRGRAYEMLLEVDFWQMHDCRKPTQTEMFKGYFGRGL